MVVFDDREAVGAPLTAVQVVRLAWPRLRGAGRLVARARATVAALRRRRPILGQSRPYGLYLERVPADATGACDGDG